MITIVASGGFLALVALLSLTDLRTRRLPNAMVAGLFAIGVLYALSDVGEGALHALLGSSIGLGLLLLVAEVFRRIRNLNGLGGGDIKLAGALGAWVGPWGVAPTFALASLSALLTVLVFSAAGWRIERTTKIPFGPYLAVAGFSVWIALSDPFALQAEFN